MIAMSDSIYDIMDGWQIGELRVADNPVPGTKSLGIDL
jgi:hypothetical protein